MLQYEWFSISSIEKGGIYPMRCKNCGSENEDGRYICQNCGSPLY
ncbi:MAG: zinc-ribbon domain-containing protein, partial [Eubacterium sp.]|nr:zinc-ribbon domain-containing protein [Eubacterium sp.]